MKTSSCAAEPGPSIDQVPTSAQQPVEQSAASDSKAPQDPTSAQTTTAQQSVEQSAAAAMDAPNSEAPPYQQDQAPQLEALHPTHPEAANQPGSVFLAAGQSARAPHANLQHRRVPQDSFETPRMRPQQTPTIPRMPLQSDARTPRQGEMPQRLFPQRLAHHPGQDVRREQRQQRPSPTYGNYADLVANAQLQSPFTGGRSADLGETEMQEVQQDNENDAQDAPQDPQYYYSGNGYPAEGAHGGPGFQDSGRGYVDDRGIWQGDQWDVPQRTRDANLQEVVRYNRQQPEDVNPQGEVWYSRQQNNPGHDAGLQGVGFNDRDREQVYYDHQGYPVQERAFHTPAQGHDPRDNRTYNDQPTGYEHQGYPVQERAIHTPAQGHYPRDNRTYNDQPTAYRQQYAQRDQYPYATRGSNYRGGLYPVNRVGAPIRKPQCHLDST
jgi:hypothetical protein